MALLVSVQVCIYKPTISILTSEDLHRIGVTIPLVVCNTMSELSLCTLLRPPHAFWNLARHDVEEQVCTWQLLKVLKTTRAKVTHQSLGSLWEQLLSEEIQHWVKSIAALQQQQFPCKAAMSFTLLSISLHAVARCTILSPDTIWL